MVVLFLVELKSTSEQILRLYGCNNGNYNTQIKYRFVLLFVLWIGVYDFGHMLHNEYGI